MPRLRYKKSYDFTLYEQEDERSDTENGSGDETEESSGRSWLSNAVIASQLSETKIKQAIAALKAQISVLESELLSRRLSGGHIPNKNWNNIGNVRRPKDANSLQQQSSARKGRRSSKCNQFQKVAALRKTLKKLGVVDIDELLATWSKLNEKEK